MNINVNHSLPPIISDDAAAGIAVAIAVYAICRLLAAFLKEL